MQWVWEDLSFRGKVFSAAHFEAPEPGRCREEVSDLDVANLFRCEAELGACLWHETNSEALSFLERRRASYAGLRVLELGAGPGVPGLALAQDGAQVTVTDLPALVPLLQLNAKRNGFGTEGDAGFSAVGSCPPGNEEASVKKRGRKKPQRRKGGRDAADSDDEWAANGGAIAAQLGVDRAEREHLGLDAADRQYQEVAADGDKKMTARQRKAAREVAKAAKEKDGGARVVGQASSIEDGSVLCVPTEAQDALAEDAPAIAASCTAQAADWVEEAADPTLAAASFDVLMVIDCLYENKDSWTYLQMVLEHSAAPDAEIIFASATLRRPFLEEFASILVDSNFAIVAREVSEHVAIVVFSPPAA